MLRARALEQALRMLIDAAVQTACKIAEDGDRRWHVVDLVCATNDAEKLLAVDPPPSGASSVDAPIYRQVYIVTHYPEGGLRGVHASQAGAEAEIAELCREYPDYTRQDFSIVCDRIRPSPPSGASPQAETSASEVAYEHMLAQRGLDRETDTICVKCYGSGVRAYGNTATWRGGIGGSTITMDVCDRCWGSGNDTKRWPSHRLSPAPVSPVVPEPPTNPPCARCGHALSAHRPEFGACDGRDRPCACPEYQVPTVEPEPPEELPCYCDIPSHILDLGCPRHQAPQCEPEPPKTWSLEIINRTGFTVEPEPCVWRDIDSAPKDGTEILVGSASLGPVVVKWKEGRSTMRDTDWMVSWDGDYLASEPYGWMPIPAPLKVER